MNLKRIYFIVVENYVYLIPHIIEEDYIFDSAKSVVIYFLSNATTWRGETARRVKTELKKMAGLK